MRRARERVSGAIASAPVPEAVKQTASRASAGVQTAAQQAAQGGAAARDAAERAAAGVSTRLSGSPPPTDPESPAPPA